MRLRITPVSPPVTLAAIKAFLLLSVQRFCSIIICVGIYLSPDSCADQIWGLRKSQNYMDTGPETLENHKAIQSESMRCRHFRNMFLKGYPLEAKIATKN